MHFSETGRSRELGAGGVRETEGENAGYGNPNKAETEHVREKDSKRVCPWNYPQTKN